MLLEEKFKIQVTKSEGKSIVFLQGDIDEDSVFDELLALGSPVVLDFKDVTSINSCGIRNWVNFLKNLVGREIYYQQCPPLIVRQMNMVPSFVGHANVLSVFAPYVCEHCEEEKLVLIDKNGFKGAIEESFPCTKCKEGVMELDGHPKQYIAFAK